MTFSIGWLCKLCLHLLHVLISKIEQVLCSFIIRETNLLEGYKQKVLLYKTVSLCLITIRVSQKCGCSYILFNMTPPSPLAFPWWWRSILVLFSPTWWGRPDHDPPLPLGYQCPTKDSACVFESERDPAQLKRIYIYMLYSKTYGSNAHGWQKYFINIVVLTDWWYFKFTVKMTGHSLCGRKAKYKLIIGLTSVRAWSI